MQIPMLWIIPDFYNKELKNLISLLLCVDMKKRPTITQLLNVSFIKDKLLCLDKKVLNDEKYYNDKLLDTITFPNNVDELNNVLPTIINYKNSNNDDRKIHYVMKVKRKTNSNKIRTSLSVDTKKDNINEISININKCEDKSVDEVIQFFNEYNMGGNRDGIYGIYRKNSK